MTWEGGKWNCGREDFREKNVKERGNERKKMIKGLTRGKIALFSFSFERQLFEQKRLPESRRYG